MYSITRPMCDNRRLKNKKTHTKTKDGSEGTRERQCFCSPRAELRREEAGGAAEMRGGRLDARRHRLACCFKTRPREDRDESSRGGTVSCVFFKT